MLEHAQNLVAAATDRKEQAAERAREIHDIYQQTQTAQNQLLSLIQQINTAVEQATQSAAKANVSATEVASHAERIQKFIKEVNDHEKRLMEAVKSAQDAVEKANEDYKQFHAEKQSEVDDLLARLSDIERDIKDKLAKATGITLFHTFETRQKQIRGHWIWLGISLVTFLSGLWFAYSLLVNVNLLDVAFFIKLGFTVPVILIVSFALSQYSRERRLQEEYAFKSAISLSLEAYRNLVEQVVEKLTPEEKKHFADFLVESIRIIFDPPTERVFGKTSFHKLPNPRLMAQMSEFIKQVKSLIETVK